MADDFATRTTNTTTDVVKTNRLFANVGELQSLYVDDSYLYTATSEATFVHQTGVPSTIDMHSASVSRSLTSLEGG